MDPHEENRSQLSDLKCQTLKEGMSLNANQNNSPEIENVMCVNKFDDKLTTNYCKPVQTLDDLMNGKENEYSTNCLNPEAGFENRLPHSQCSQSPGCQEIDKNCQEVEEIDTKEVAQKITSDLRKYNIPQYVFSKTVLGRSQSVLSEMLRNPKPWSDLKSSKETFRKMWKWLQEPVHQRVVALQRAVDRPCCVCQKLCNQSEETGYPLSVEKCPQYGVLKIKNLPETLICQTCYDGPYGNQARRLSEVISNDFEEPKSDNFEIYSPDENSKLVCGEGESTEPVCYDDKKTNPVCSESKGSELDCSENKSTQPVCSVNKGTKQVCGKVENSRSGISESKSTILGVKEGRVNGPVCTEDKNSKPVCSEGKSSRPVCSGSNEKSVSNEKICEKIQNVDSEICFKCPRCSKVMYKSDNKCSLPGRYFVLSPDLKQKVKSQLGITYENKKICSACYKTINRRCISVEKANKTMTKPSTSTSPTASVNLAKSSDEQDSIKMRKMYACGWCKFQSPLFSSVLRHHYKSHEKQEVDIVRQKTPNAKHESSKIGFSCESCDYRGSLRHQLHIHNDRFHKNSENREGITDYESDSAFSKLLPSNYHHMQEKYKLKDVKIPCQDIFKSGLKHLMKSVYEEGISKLCVDSLTEDEFISMATLYREDVSYCDTGVENYIPVNFHDLKQQEITKIIKNN